MWKITLKNLAANKVRLALTTLAIVLGVGFISAANILSDGLRESFASLSTEIVGGTDLSVTRDSNDVEITSADLETIRATDGVRVAVGGIEAPQDSVLPILEDGTALTSQGPPILAFNWSDEVQLSPLTIETGRAPVGLNEFVIDLGSAARNDFVVGETYELVVPTEAGKSSATLVGTTRFGQNNVTNGATLMSFSTEAAHELFGSPDIYDSVAIAVDGTRAVPDVQADIAEALGEGYRLQDNADLNAQQRANFNSFIDVFAWILRIFAIIALFVSIFIIANTFKIVMGQRVRELGLLRAVGATPRQVRRAVLGEALVVGIFASLVGIVAGVGLAYGLEALLNAVGAELPDFGKPVSASTVIIALLVGVVVTVLSAWLPARKAGRIAPITAISGIEQLDENESRRSLIVGGLLSVVGLVLTLVALFGSIEATSTVLILLGVGAAILFIGITLLSPTVSAPLSRFLGAPLRAVLGRVGLLATENAARNPKRTATTAAALMIGLSLVSMAFVVGQTLKNDLNALLESTVQADYAAFPVSDNGGLIPVAAADRMAESESFDNVTGIKYWGTETGVTGSDAALWEGYEVGAMDYAAIDELLDLDLQAGSFADIDDDSLAIRSNLAEELLVEMGDSVSMIQQDGSIVDLEIVAIFEDGNIFEGTMVSEARWDLIGDQANFDWVAATTATDDAAVLDADIAAISSEFPQVNLQSAATYREEISGQVDFLLQMLSGFLGLAILIAFIGIVNTMALSIYERTRELGLLRAVGMTRRQMHGMIRWEAAIVSGVGAILGAVVGVVFGVLVVVATPDEILSDLAIPWISLIVLVIVASLAGLVAGFLPARRAGKLNVLDAIAH